MKSVKQILNGGPKDERLTAQLGPIYKTGFYIMVFGILFDVYTRYNYLAQIDANGNPMVSSPIELGVLFVACLVVITMAMRKNVYSDSLRFTEARTFGETGMVALAIGTAVLISVAAVGGRLFNEVAIYGWGGVTWAGDLAMFVIMLCMFTPLLLLGCYSAWKNYRTREDRMAQEEDSDFSHA